MRGPRLSRRDIAAALLVSSAIVTLRLTPDATLERFRLVRGIRLEADRVSPAEAEAEPSLDRRLECDTQAARVAAWRGRISDGSPGQEPAWLGRYSGRDQVCYVAVTRMVATGNGAPPPLVTELWNGFDATLMATFTDDRRAEMRRDFCRIDLADDPFTSCLAAEFFIRQHVSR